MIKTFYCKKCVYPSHSVNISFDEKGVCSSCNAISKFTQISESEWKKRKEIFEKILINGTKNNNSNYDVLIPVSGGKDSYYQTHLICREFKHLNLKPLLVTYDGDNFLEEGIQNRDKMKDLFNVDHIIFSPSIEKLKILNLVGFKVMGDMNWHNHAGIETYPVAVASKYQIPLVIWGETIADIWGMHEPDDYVEMSNRMRIEHVMRGFEHDDMVKASDGQLSKKDLLWAIYPEEEDLLKNNIKGLYIGNFFPWRPNDHYELMKKLYNWQPAKKPFERTYRQFSNLDNIFENGVHDLMKFIKFGYGRASDHSGKDIRDGVMTREEGVKMVEKYDHVISSDLEYWCDYVNITKEEFFKTADKFREPSIWWIKNKEWYKNCIDGTAKPFGDVHLDKEEIENFIMKQKSFLSESN
jgi:N-acetyl sugar amidotransferase